MEAIPLVSVVVPIFNVASFLRQCLESLRAQTLQDIEFICVNDGSTDESPRILEEVVSGDQRFVVINKENGGYGSAVNVGIERARGAYLGIVEPDDYVDPTMYERLITTAATHDDPDIVKAAYWRVICSENSEEILPANYFHRIPDGATFTLTENAEFLFHHPSIWSAIYRKDFLDRHGIRMHEIPGAGWADNPWLIDTLVRAESIVYVDECLYYYREFNVGSSSVVKDPTILSDRWVDMDDIIRKLHVKSPLILEGHYNRACWHIRFLLEGFDPDDPVTKECVKKIARRVNYSFVCDCPRIDQELKDLLHSNTGAFPHLVHRMRDKLGKHYVIE